MNTSAELAPYVAQFVPVKLDTSTAAYREFDKSHPHEGRGIPILYIVGADGKTFYAKSGLLKPNELGPILAACLNQTGRILSAQEATALVQVNDQLTELRGKGDIQGAIKLLKRLRKFGTPGALGSYAQPAVAIDSQVIEMVDAGQKLTRDITKRLLDAKDEPTKLSALRNFLSESDRYKGFTGLKKDFATVSKTINRDPTLKLLFRGVKTIEAAESAKSIKSQERSIIKLESLIKDLDDGPLKTRATNLIQQMQDAMGDS